MLVETDPVPHLLIDVRSEVESLAAPVPAPLANATVRVEQIELEGALQEAGAWAAAAPGRPLPSKDTMLVFVGGTEEAKMAAASLVAALGYSRCAVMGGRIEDCTPEAMGRAPQTFMDRNALAQLLQLRTEGGATRATVVDLRRHDERTLYGFIPGTKHLPTEQFASALSLEPADFEATYHFPKPAPDELIVMQCRTNRRAAWAAQVASDLGYKKAIIYRQGVYGWRFDASVAAYGSYDAGDPPPAPEPFQTELPDLAQGAEELNALGVN